MVRQGSSQISGSRIIFYIREDRAVAEGGSQRVTATIYPEELQKNMQATGVGSDGHERAQSGGDFKIL